MKSESKIAMGGGAKASKKLMAAFAVLAIVFAAVAVVGVDSDADDTSTMVPVSANEVTKTSGSPTLAASGKYYVDNNYTANIGGNTGILFIVQDGKQLTLRGTASTKVQVAIGSQKTDGSYEYDSETLITYSVDTGSDGLTAKSGSPGYFTYVPATAKNGSVVSGVVATESATSTASTQTVKVYSLNADDVSVVLKHTANDSVQVSAQSTDKFETDVTVSYTNVQTPSTLNQIKIVATDGETDLTIKANAASHNGLKIDTEKTYSGTISVLKGVFDVGTNDLKGKVSGIDVLASSNHSWYPLSGDIAIGNDYTVSIYQGTELTGPVYMENGTTTKVTLPYGFKVNTLNSNTATTALTFLYEYTAGGPGNPPSEDVITVTGASGTGASATNWTGKMTVAAAKLEFADATKLGQVEAIDAEVGDGSAKAEVVVGAELKLSGNLTITSASTTPSKVTVASAGSLDIDGKVILKDHNANLIIKSGATVTADLGAKADKYLAYLTGVKASADMTFSINTSTMTVTGSYSEGEISGPTTAGSYDIATVSIGGSIDKFNMPLAAVALSGALRVNGTFVAKTLTSTASALTFAGKTAELKTVGSGYSTLAGQVITISEGTILTLSGAENTDTFGMTITGSKSVLNVLGQITGSKIQATNSGVICTSDGVVSTHIKSGNSLGTTVDEATYETGTGPACYADHFDDMMDAISLGFNQVKLKGAAAVDKNCEIPSDVIVFGARNITVAAKCTLVVRGEIQQADTIGGAVGAEGITLGSDSAATGADEAVLNNQGKIKIGNSGLTACANSYVMNSGTLDLSGATSESKVVGLFENNGTLKLPTAAVALTIGTYDSTEKVSSKTEFSNNGTIEAAGCLIEIKQGSTLVNRGKIDSEGAAKIWGAGTFDNEGSGTVGIAVNTVYVKGVTSTVKIQDDMTQKVTYMSLQTLQVPADATLDLTNVAKIGVNGKFIIDGTLTVYGKLTIAASVFDAQAAELVLNGTIVVANGGELYIGGLASYEDGLRGSGKLTVNAGASITVQNGGELIIQQGSASIVGSLTMDAGSQLTVNASTDAAVPTTKKAGYLSVSGTANLNGYLNQANSKGLTISNYGTITIDNDSNDVRTGTDAAKKTGAVCINMAADAATLTIESLLMEDESNTSLTVTDAGLCTYYDAKISANSKYIPSTNADVITIEFNSDSTRTTVSLDKVVVDGTLVIKQSASYKSVTKTDGTKDKQQNYSMDVSGDISAAFTYGSTVETVKDRIALGITAAGSVKFTGDTKVVENAGGVKVSDELELGQYVSTAVSAENGGKLTVSGSIINDGTGAAQIVAERDSTIDVSGSIVSSNTIDASAGGVVNAVYYNTIIEVEKKKVTTHYYTTLDSAIEGVQVEGNTADKVVTVMGAVTLKKDATLPSTVKMTMASNAKLNVGTSTARATLTAEAQISSSSGQINVVGTLLFVDKANDKTVKTVSDVMYESGDSRIYTNIYTAIENAGQSSDAMTITVTKEPGTSNAKVELDQNLNIPSNVTLVVGDSVHTAGLLLKDGVTLTIDGTLQTSQDIAAKTRFAANAVNTDDYKSSAITVNGMLKIAEDVKAGTTVVYGDGSAAYKAALTSSAPVYGAYYSIQGWDVITNIDDALKETKITSPAITVYGPVKGSDGTVTANDDFSEVVVEDEYIYTYGTSTTKIETSLIMNSLTLGDDTSIEMIGAFTGTVVVGDNAADFGKIAGITAAENDGDLVLTGTVQIGKDMSLTVSSGTVVLGTDKDGFCQNYSTDYPASGKYAERAKFAVNIATGATAEIVGTSDWFYFLVVDGTLEVPAGTSASAYMLQVNGSVKVGEATASATAGSLTATEAYVGMTYDDTVSTGASASVAGPLALRENGKLYVVAGASVEEIDDDWKSTAFYNGGSLWFTAYANGSSVKIYVTEAPLTNAVLDGWSKTEGGDADYGTSAAITVGENDKLYAVVDTEIYVIIIRADTGIGDLYLNGNIMMKGTLGTQYMSYTAFWATVAAGDYEVTCKLNNGYSGTAVLKDMDGKAVSNNKISVSGDPDSFEYQLTGVEKSGYVQPTEEKDDSGLTVTDYLLIVLVILVVVLAVIVALRLMRS